MDANSKLMEKAVSSMEKLDMAAFVQVGPALLCGSVGLSLFIFSLTPSLYFPTLLSEFKRADHKVSTVK